MTRQYSYSNHNVLYFNTLMAGPVEGPVSSNLLTPICTLIDHFLVPTAQSLFGPCITLQLTTTLLLLLSRPEINYMYIKMSFIMLTFNNIITKTSLGANRIFTAEKKKKKKKKENFSVDMVAK